MGEKMDTFEKRAYVWATILVYMFDIRQFLNRVGFAPRHPSRT